MVYKCTYSESRKMVLKNLFAGQQWRNRHREQTYGQGERGETEMYEESNMETYIGIYKIDNEWEFALSQGTLTRALYQPRGVEWGRRWEGGARGKGNMYNYG